MARYRTRALLAASSIGLLIGASAGAAYLGGRLARDASASSHAERLMQMAELNGDMTPSAALGVQPLDATALNIANRFAPYGGGSDAQSAQVDQTVTAMRISDDMRSHKGLVVRAGESVETSPLRTIPLYSDHPVRPAAAMVFKARTQNDSDCLTQAVYYEARGEGTDGMRAVAQVILNRVRHPAFPKTICGVVYQGANRGISCQFSFVCNGAMGRPVEAWGWRRAKDIAAAALEGYVMKTVGTATHFHTTNVSPMWANSMVRITAVGSHVFYQFRGRGAHIDTDIDDISPSDDVPVMAQADAAAPEANAMTAAAPVAKDVKDQQLITTLQKLDSSAKPVALSAKLTGQPAETVAAVLTQTAPAPTKIAQQ